ncbi:UNVERIFIED_CONTAM: hypothetical protein Slati_3832600 [Sesamum latifolium]|uniref:Uncharacterized protein n=1 Tax=Sesamum latifolium TaxID=2727402 RepID=A0AAW2TLH1_9LAMI
MGQLPRPLPFDRPQTSYAWPGGWPNKPRGGFPLPRCQKSPYELGQPVFGAPPHGPLLEPSSLVVASSLPSQPADISLQPPSSNPSTWPPLPASVLPYPLASSWKLPLKPGLVSLESVITFPPSGQSPRSHQDQENKSFSIKGYQDKNIPPGKQTYLGQHQGQHSVQVFRG